MLKGTRGLIPDQKESTIPCSVLTSNFRFDEGSVSKAENFSKMPTVFVIV